MLERFAHSSCITWVKGGTYWGCAMLVHHPQKQLILRNVNINCMWTDEVLLYAAFGLEWYMLIASQLIIFNGSQWKYVNGHKTTGWDTVKVIICQPLSLIPKWMLGLSKLLLFAEWNYKPIRHEIFRQNSSICKVCLKVWRLEMTYISIWNKQCKLYQNV